MKKIILAVSAVFAFAACNINYDKTPSGLVYKTFSGKGGEKLQVGNIVKYNVEFVLTDRKDKKDSVLNPNVSIPNYIQVDTGKRYEYSFVEVMPKLSAGDSAVVVLSVDSLKKRNQIEYNETFVKGSSIKCNLKILKAFKVQKDAVADYQKEIETENKRETKSVEDYMAQKGIKGSIKTKSGAYVAVENPGDQTMKADSGKVATIRYKGYLQSNGKVFDTNFDTSKGHAQPYPVTVGAHGVIPAWEEALPYFGKGGSGKILVPAFLGYGAQGRPPDIAPYSNIIFDIQVLDVTVAPPTPKNNQMQAPQKKGKQVKPN
jgi:FKBP-type peptidyl-prolyl cis-trans isomerase FkpA